MSRTSRPVGFRCQSCGRAWSSELPLAEGSCPDCGSWNVVGIYPSPAPMIVLILVFLLSCFVLTHPQSLARLLGR